ncbi:hypothetical protein J8N05_46990 (plasmid) [Streptomyces sp. BH-SS-21]|uniref:Uncharacterized protein n=1 Tax=Streptomyces liliiviolaceus TaxID=2823109 RepID=A0A940Y6Y9_9ACTN|nr:hypothetical protein [Streptomyces liliiviolaceus]MBQ0855708.1 hypothetical protein [Streptomyces liliiviolaceus]
MSESAFEYRQARAEYGSTCADPRDLAHYLNRISLDAQSLRHGLAEAITHVFRGTAAPNAGTAELPYPADRVERALFDDSMQSVKQLLVADPALAASLRHTMRLLEDAAEAARLVRVLLERPDEETAMERLTSEADFGPAGGN